MEFVRHFGQETYQRALKDWAWLDPVSRLTPRFTNAFGDVFLEDASGAFWFLDTLEGTVKKLWPDTAAMHAALNTFEAQDMYLAQGLAQSAYQAGLVPEPSQILSYKISPVIGGSFALDNLEVFDFTLALSISGQIRSQVRNMPPGTKISGFSITPPKSPGSTPRRRRRIWPRNS